MNLRKNLLFGCQIAATACLGLGYLSVGGWVALLVVACSVVAWLAVWKWPISIPFSLALIVSVSLAGAGLIAGALPILILLYVVLSLATWDLAEFYQETRFNEPSHLTALLEKKHLTRLGMALGFGLLAFILSRGIRFQIPFGVVLLLVALAFFSLDRLWRALAN